MIYRWWFIIAGLKFQGGYPCWTWKKHFRTELYKGTASLEVFSFLDFLTFCGKRKLDWLVQFFKITDTGQPWKKKWWLFLIVYFCWFEAPRGVSVLSWTNQKYIKGQLLFFFDFWNLLARSKGTELASPTRMEINDFSERNKKRKIWWLIIAGVLWLLLWDNAGFQGLL